MPAPGLQWGLDLCSKTPQTKSPGQLDHSRPGSPAAGHHFLLVGNVEKSGERPQGLNPASPQPLPRTLLFSGKQKERQALSALQGGRAAEEGEAALVAKAQSVPAWL